MYNVVDSNGHVVVGGFASRTEAKVQRTPDQFVVRSPRHPLGASKVTGGLQARIGSLSIKDKEGKVIRTDENVRLR